MAESEIRSKCIQQILDKNPENAAKILKDLGLSGLPSRAQVHHEIEEKLLLPREKLPAHWLPLYQMYELFRSGCLYLNKFYIGTVIGSMSCPSQPYCDSHLRRHLQACLLFAQVSVAALLDIPKYVHLTYPCCIDVNAIAVSQSPGYHWPHIDFFGSCARSQ